MAKGNHTENDASSEGKREAQINECWSKPQAELLKVNYLGRRELR